MKLPLRPAEITDARVCVSAIAENRRVKVAEPIVLLCTWADSVNRIGRRFAQKYAPAGSAPVRRIDDSNPIPHRPAYAPDTEASWPASTTPATLALNVAADVHPQALHIRRVEPE